MVLRYATGEEVRVGDRVRVRRLLRQPLEAVVESVYDPTKPSPPKGDNDMGFSVHASIHSGHPTRGCKARARALDGETLPAKSNDDRSDW